jgi:hypothetical protein
MHYKLSAPSRLRLSAKDRGAIEMMLGRVLEGCGSMAYRPLGRTIYEIRKDVDCCLIFIHRGDDVYEITASLMAA